MWWLLRSGDENPFNLCGFYFKTQTRLLLGLDKHLDLEKLVISSLIFVVGRLYTREGRNERTFSCLLVVYNVRMRKISM